MNKSDISECEFLQNTSCICRGSLKDDGLHVHLKCSDNPNCYYKQLQKAEQKLEKIKEIAKDIIKNDCYENSDIKAENILKIIGEK